MPRVKVGGALSKRKSQSSRRAIARQHLAAEGVASKRALARKDITDGLNAEVLENCTMEDMHESMRLESITLVRRYREGLKAVMWALILIAYVGFLFVQQRPDVQYEHTKGASKFMLESLPKYTGELTDVTSWLKYAIINKWKDPVCGDGVCEAPYEFPAYAGFGCKPDCGVEKNTVNAFVHMAANFVHPRIATHKLLPISSWNVCKRDDFRQSVGLDDVCYYENDQLF